MRWLALLALGTLACQGRGGQEPAATRSQPSGDPARGAVLFEQFECNRCHAATAVSSLPAEKQCTACHRNRRGEVRHFLDLPSLAGVGKRLRRGWVERYLRGPVDLRPNLEESMPALELSAEQARDIAAYLAPDEAVQQYEPSGDLERGRKLLDSKGCGACHTMSGAPPLAVSPIPVALEPERLRAAQLLAPDLRHARQRLLPYAVERWLERPSQVASDALMPDIPLSTQEVRDIAAYLMNAPLAAANKPAIAARLPLLERPVAYEEVARQVFLDSCWHCHSDAESRIGDGGPGNTGGFGFKGRGINLSAHEHVLSGYLDDSGERRSLFEAEGASRDGRLMRALLARRDEQAGESDSTIRGMPLGLPALSPEKIQLVESWIAQGRPE